jgi:hypothetical protein
MFVFFAVYLLGAYYSFVFLALHFHLMYSHAMTILFLSVGAADPENGHVCLRDLDEHLTCFRETRLLSVLSAGRKMHGSKLTPVF